jgi:hypothetical protein
MVYLENNDVQKIISIEYGLPNNYTNITKYVLDNLVGNNILRISKTLNLNELFGDPLINIAKHIRIELLQNNNVEIIYIKEFQNFLLDDFIIYLEERENILLEMGEINEKNNINDIINI